MQYLCNQETGGVDVPGIFLRVVLHVLYSGNKDDRGASVPREVPASSSIVECSSPHLVLAPE